MGEEVRKIKKYFKRLIIKTKTRDVVSKRRCLLDLVLPIKLYTSCKGIIKEGIFCQNVDVELDLSRGLFSFLIVGLADKCIGESRERIISAIKNSGFDSPKTKNHKITVSLVPAGIKKEGVLLDLPISLAYLSSVNKIKKESLENSIFIGELGLDGSIKQNDSLASVVNFVMKTTCNTRTINLYSNFKEDQISLINQLKIPNIKIFSFNHLQVLTRFLNKEGLFEVVGIGQKTNAIIPATVPFTVPAAVPIIMPACAQITAEPKEKQTALSAKPEEIFEIDKILGQEKAKRALLISICGNYNLIMSGPPGVGKTMLAKSAHQLLPNPNKNEYLELLSIHNKIERPFRSPHHTSSYASIVGGGTPISAGEITKAHKGILFLDELPEFNKNIIESLRQPLEQKVIQINRVSDTINLPCDTLCICAMNLCPCGNRGIPLRECDCSGVKINLYKQKVSQPFLERFHISINLPYENKTKNFIETDSHNTKNNYRNGNGSGDCLKGKQMKEIINIVNKIEHKNIEFEWGKEELRFLYAKAEENIFSMRAIGQIRDISETICLIENIQNKKISPNKNSDSNTFVDNFRQEKIKLKLDYKNLLEAFSYKNNLLT